MGKPRTLNLVFKMAAIKGSKGETDAQVSFDDQQKINLFARTNTQLNDAKEELAAREKELQNLTDAEDELLMAEDDTALIPYMIGEVLVEMTSDEVTVELEKAKQACQDNMERLKSRMDGFKETLSQLKTSLYAKFGSNINLDVDEES